MDFKEKRKELMALWEDSFALCQAFINAAKTGEAKFSASMLKEINGFLRLSTEVLDTAEEHEARERTLAVTSMDPQGFLMDGLTAEDLDVPETFKG
jgi:hypothetical protein